MTLNKIMLTIAVVCLTAAMILALHVAYVISDLATSLARIQQTLPGIEQVLDTTPTKR